MGKTVSSFPTLPCLILLMAAHSRNARLSAEARRKAPAIYQALQWAQGAVSSGLHTSTSDLQAHVAKEIEEAGGKIDYIEVRGRYSSSRRWWYL